MVKRDFTPEELAARAVVTSDGSPFRIEVRKSRVCTMCGAKEGYPHQQDEHEGREPARIVTIHRVKHLDGVRRPTCMFCRNGIRSLRRDGPPIPIPK